MSINSYDQIAGKFDQDRTRLCPQESEHDPTRNPASFTDTMYGHEFYYDSLTPAQMVALMEDLGFKILLAEMCDLPDGARNKGKWATIAAKA